MRLFWLSTLAMMVLAGAGCGGVDEVRDEADEAISRLTFAYSEGRFGVEDKTDGFFSPDVCEVLGDLVASGDGTLRLGFYMGVQGDVFYGHASVMGGYDVVFDLYHRQMTVSRYVGGGLGWAELGAGVTYYQGFAAGFDKHVNEWNGWFGTAMLEIGLPYLKDYIAIVPEVFVSAEDLDDNGYITPGELIAPPEGIYGFSIGLELGYSLLPTGLPLSGLVTEGRWRQSKEGTRRFYDMLKGLGILGIFDLRCELVDPETGAPCPDAWPNEGGAQECVVQFGDEDWSNVHSALHLSWAICELNGGCLSPLAGSSALSAIGIGAFQDAGGRLEELCPDLATSLP